MKSGDEAKEYLESLIEELEDDRPNIRFQRLKNICTKVFGECRVKGSRSHHIFKTPWPGDPRINLQETGGGKAKSYQIRQVIKALQKRIELID